MTPTFLRAFEAILGHEGGHSLDPRDRGNWTSGVVGQGVLKGTKFGVAAHIYPDLDIAALTLDDARAIYWRDYWLRLACDAMPPALALTVFDAGVNAGQPSAARWLQIAVGAKVDGQIGPRTRQALAAALARPDGTLEVIVEVMARRMVSNGDAATWPIHKLGWSRRLARLPFQALMMEAAP